MSINFSKNPLYKIVVPVSHLVLFAGIYFTGITFLQIILALLIFLVCDFASNVGYHKLLSHRAFVAKKWVTPTLSMINVLSMIGDPLSWVATHRTHHKYSDTELDPHNRAVGRWYAYYGWFFDDKNYNIGPMVIKDLLKEYKWMPVLQRYTAIIPVVFYTLLFIISVPVAVTVLLGSLLNVHKLLYLNGMGHDINSDGKPAPINNQFAAIWVAPVFMHLNHHTVPYLYDYSTPDVPDRTVWIIENILMEKQ